MSSESDELHDLLERIQELIRVVEDEAHELGPLRPDYVRGRLTVARQINQMIDEYYSMPEQ